MIFEEFGVIELEKYLEELKRDYPIYGDVCCYTNWRFPLKIPLEKIPTTI